MLQGNRIKTGHKSGTGCHHAHCPLVPMRAGSQDGLGGGETDGERPCPFGKHSIMF